MSGRIVRPYILTVAGFDPSAGAGLQADLKTFENLKVYGLTVCTSITYQNADEFLKVDWLSQEQIQEQIRIVLSRYHTDYVKIGLVASFDMLSAIIKTLKDVNPQVKIIWDPVLKSSTGFEFHSKLDGLEKILNDIYLLTPNCEEASALVGISAPRDAAQKLAAYCNVYLKGGHSKDEKGRDYLYANGKIYPYRPRYRQVWEKHGSGCVLSSAITAFLAKGFPLLRAGLMAKEYTERFLASTTEKLGFHKR